MPGGALLGFKGAGFFFSLFPYLLAPLLSYLFGCCQALPVERHPRLLTAMIRARLTASRSPKKKIYLAGAS